MKNATPDHIKMWGLHCTTLENSVIAVRSLVKTCEKAALNGALLHDEDLMSAINYTLGMASEILEFMENEICIPASADYYPTPQPTT
jgi:hypothetical protein